MSITLKTLISNRRGREGERDRNGSGWRGETQSKYTSWGQWRGEKVSLHWKPQCDEKLSSEAQERGEHRQRKREDVRGGEKVLLLPVTFTCLSGRWTDEIRLLLSALESRSCTLPAPDAPSFSLWCLRSPGSYPKMSGAQWFLIVSCPLMRLLRSCLAL